MSDSATCSSTPVGPVSAQSLDPGRMPTGHRRKRLVAAGVLLVVVAVAAVGIGDSIGKNNPGASGSRDNGTPPSLTVVTHRSLSSQTSVNGTLGYAGSTSIVNEAQGHITWLPAAGQVISQAQVLYQVDGSPVVLLYGSTPVYRALAEGASASDVTGSDVAELNADLVTLGYATAAQIPADSNEFSWWTKQAVEKLQAALGVVQSGTLDFGQVVFVPTAARITTISATLGASAGPGQTILSASSTTRQVTISLDAAQQSEIKVGNKVSITLPNGTSTPGVVSSVGAVASVPSGGGSNATPTVPVEVAPTDPTATGSLDQAPVQVSITTATVAHALVVPVTALTALSNGGYAVEVVDVGGVHHLVGVTLGIFDDADGLVQVTGPGLAAGQRVVVPAR